MPNIRRAVVRGDHIFVVSGKVSNVEQFVVGGFEVNEKLDALAAYRRFPNQRLHQRADGQLTGNIIVNDEGKQHPLDGHSNFARRVENYIVGCNPIALSRPDEIRRGRRETLDFLRFLFRRSGFSPLRVLGRWRRMDEHEVIEMRDWLSSLKSSS
jgi:hypothetical protein